MSKTSSTERFNLAKGERFNLTKESGGATNFYFGLGWDAPDTRNGVTFDCDASVFACAYNSARKPKIVSDGHFVFYHNLQSSDGAIIHSGDNLTGNGDGDDEQIRVYLDRLDPKVEIMSIIVTIHNALSKGQNFGQVKNAKIRVCEMDADGNPTNELFVFDLSEDYSGFTALHFGDIYRHDDGSWRWHAQGASFKNTELKQIVDIYCN